jgi:hypothetical protein
MCANRPNRASSHACANSDPNTETYFHTNARGSAHRYAFPTHGDPPSSAN